MQTQLPVPGLIFVFAFGCAGITATSPARAQNSNQLAQRRLLCVRLSPELTQPGAIAAFKRCLNSSDPLETARQQAVPRGLEPAKRPQLVTPPSE
jgi:hypothetical protein